MRKNTIPTHVQLIFVSMKCYIYTLHLSRKLDSYLPPIEYTVIFIIKLFYCINELDKNNEISLRRRDQVFKIHEEDGVTFELQMTIVNVPRIVFGNLNIFKLQILILLCCKTFQITFNIFLFSITLNGKDNYCR